MRPGEYLSAYLDDTFILSQPERARPLYNAIGPSTQLNTGKNHSRRTWMIWEEAFGALRESRFSVRPSGLKRSCRHSLVDDSKLNNVCGVQSLRSQTSSALGSCSCSALARVATTHAAGHDAGMQQNMVALLGTLPGDQERTTLAQSGILACEIGRFRLPVGNASRTSCVLGLQERVPEATAIITRELAGIPRGCLGELHTACGILDREGFVGRPTWEELLAVEAADPGEWQHGRQYHASSASEHHFRRT